MTAQADMRFIKLLLSCFCAVALSASLDGCEGDDDYDHNPPAGKGTLFINNFTSDDLEVFIDGGATNSVDNSDVNFYDLMPGKHRLVFFDDDDSFRQFHDDVDVLVGEKTILEVSYDSADVNLYDVFIYFQ